MGGAPASFCLVRCPACGVDDTKVVDSRAVDGGAVTRRRRSCERCRHRFTTFERVEIVPVRVAKRSGGREAFDGQKILKGLAMAAKGRPVDMAAFDTLVEEVENRARLEGPNVSSEWVGLAVLERLAAIDQVACLRFASVYKGFDDIGDFEREVRLIKRDAT